MLYRIPENVKELFAKKPKRGRWHKAVDAKGRQRCVFCGKALNQAMRCPDVRYGEATGWWHE